MVANPEGSSFQVFGPPPPNHATSQLPQHGFARTSMWEFLGKSTSESESSEGGADLSVKLDFGLSSAGLSDETRALWPYAFNLIYSVTLSTGSLVTSMVATNDDERPFDLQVLMHTYFRVKVWHGTQVGKVGKIGGKVLGVQEVSLANEGSGYQLGCRNGPLGRQLY